jgi:phenylpyruvate tautomerase PptA (4-oxalocrotonate tautomerase family)
MPDVLVEVRGSWLGSGKSGFLAAIDAALEATLRVPAADRVLRLVEHPPENLVIPADRGPRFTRVEVTMFAGRSAEAKHALCQAIATGLGEFAVPPADVKVVLVEVPLDNVAVRGGHAASDLGHELPA